MSSKGNMEYRKAIRNISYKELISFHNGWNPLEYNNGTANQTLYQFLIGYISNEVLLPSRYIADMISIPYRIYF